MKRSHYDYPVRKGRVCRSTDLASVLVRWQRAVSTFQSLYETLSHTIAKRRQQDYTVAYYGISYNPSQRSLQELEQVRTEMIQELKRLLDDMAGSGHSSENVDQAAVRRLQSHTLQLQKHGQRIQTILDHP